MAEAPRKHPAPGNNAVRQAASHKRLEREIYHPEEKRPGQDILNSRNEVERFSLSRYVMRREQPTHEKNRGHESRKTKRSFAIAAAEFHIFERKQRAANHHGNKYRQQQDHEYALAITHYRSLSVSGLVPCVEDFEVDGFAFVRTGFDMYLEV